MTTCATRPSFFALAALAALLLLLLLPTVAAAHAELEATAPADDALVSGTPTELSATFSEALTDQSTLSIRAAAGARLAVGGLDPDDPARLLITPVPELAPGVYEMRWTIFSDDGHLERGTWMFEVEAALPTPTPSRPDASASVVPSAPSTPAASPATTAEASLIPVASPNGGDPTSGGDVLLPIVAALAIVAVGGVLLLGRRGRPGSAA